MRRRVLSFLGAALLQGLALAAAAQGFSPLFSGDQVRETYPHCAGLYLARLDWEAADGNPVADPEATTARALRFVALAVQRVALEAELDRLAHPSPREADEEAVRQIVARHVTAYRDFYLSQRNPAAMQAFQGNPRRAAALMHCDTLSGQ